MREYTIPEGGLNFGNSTGLYPNYPYNDLRPDIYFHDGNSPDNRTDGCDTFVQSVNSYPPLTGYKKDHFTFSSPDLMFKKPFLNAYETKIYGELTGYSIGHFIKSENHPQNKLGAALVAGIIGVGYAISRVKGNQKYGLQTASAYTDPNIQVAGLTNSIPAGKVPAATAAAAVAAAGSGASALIFDALLDDLTSIASLYTLGKFANQASFKGEHAVNALLASTPGVDSGKYYEDYNVTHPSGAIPKIINAFFSVILSKTNIATGAQEIIDLFYNLIKEDDFAFKHNSHGFYDTLIKRQAYQLFRSKNIDSNYIGST
jgi:hypothetical protein